LTVVPELPPESGPGLFTRARRALAARPLRRLLAAAAVLLALPLLLAVVNLAWRSSRFDTLVFPGSVKRLVIDVDAGDVVLGAAGRDDVLVLRTRQYSLLAPEVRAGVQGDVLRLRARCSVLSVGCAVGHRIFLPPGVPVAIHTGSGDVSVADLHAAVEVRTASGDVAVTGVRAPVVVDTGAGDVTLADDRGPVVATSRSGGIACNGIAGRLAATTGSGHVLLDDISASLDVATGSGDVDGSGLHPPDARMRTGSGDLVVKFDAPATSIAARSSAGDITIDVPDAPYRLDVTSGSGATRVLGITRAANAERSISARSDGGEVILRSR
jgi:hypothetical protein